MPTQALDFELLALDPYSFATLSYVHLEVKTLKSPLAPSESAAGSRLAKSRPNQIHGIFWVFACLWCSMPCRRLGPLGDVRKLKGAIECSHSELATWFLAKQTGGCRQTCLDNE